MIEDNEMEGEAINPAIEALRTVGATPAGRVVLWEILSMCGIYSTGYPADLIQHQDGRRSVGVELLDMLNEADKRLYITLQLEHLDEAND